MRKSLGLSMFLSFLFLGQASAQVNFSDQSGGFGPFFGLVRSNLKQPQVGGGSQSLSDMYHGWEAGIKSELYRTKWLRGNLMASYVQQGANEYFQADGNSVPVEVNLKEVKLALNPILFKVGGDYLHGYIGGGIYGSYIIEQELSNPELTAEYWNGAEKLSGADYGLDFTAGIHIWQFDIEAHAQYGLADLGTRWDGSPVRHNFFGISIAYLYVNQHLTVKSCRDHR